ncbi:MAG: NADH-quinone oxidoreductase subunit, partial [Conexibacter sp.]|nr:NADH-quinone oxidoreductase subunit [Conexibacter sp.]
HADPAMGWRERYGAERTVEVLPDEGDALLEQEAAAAAHAVNVPGAGDTDGA